VPREITDGVVAGKNYPNHEAIDFYHRYPQDLALFAEMGHKTAGQPRSAPVHRPAGKYASRQSRCGNI
jgi:hypothetical protein